MFRRRPVSIPVRKSMEFLTILGKEIEVTVKPSRTGDLGQISVVVQPN
jgi:hypothetical protein